MKTLLRLITGRRPDPELLMGLREPDNFIEQFYDPRLSGWTLGVPRRERRKHEIRQALAQIRSHDRN